MLAFTRRRAELRRDGRQA